MKIWMLLPYLCLTACTAPQNTHKQYIESMSHSGYCTNEYGQDMTDQACSAKATKDAQRATPAEPSESEKIGKGVSEAMKKRQ